MFHFCLKLSSHEVVRIQKSQVLNKKCLGKAISMSERMFFCVSKSELNCLFLKNKNVMRTFHPSFCKHNSAGYSAIDLSLTGFHFLWFVLFQPLGASDYLEISKHFDTVFVRDIPPLTMAKRTQARRFITLIDTFYEHKVRTEPFRHEQE